VTWGNAQVTVEYNNFLDVGKPTLALPDLAFEGTTLTAANNYFGTSDVSVVASMVFDKNDDQGSAGYISINPIQVSPDPTAPQIIAALDTTKSQPIVTAGQGYTGPVADLQREYVSITGDNLNVTTATPNWFIHSGSGDDAIAVNSGTNVLDGGTGSNFLTGGTGTDTFFVDDRVATSDIWSTVVGFHAGDAATIWGVTPHDFGLAWVDGQGAAGFTGLTLHATAAGKPIASLTLAGYSQADIASGRLSVSFGNDPSSGSAYMYVHGNS
jgi:serralysin